MNETTLKEPLKVTPRKIKKEKFEVSTQYKVKINKIYLIFLALNMYVLTLYLMIYILIGNLKCYPERRE